MFSVAHTLTEMQILQGVVAGAIFVSQMLQSFISDLLTLNHTKTVQRATLTRDLVQGGIGDTRVAEIQPFDRRC